ncbi:hypothetical protein SAMN04487967_1680 [Natronorubrum sediminis]|uniref:Uncharacterized protein n=1 Tax=Natronorubrum sediminis TaxID=640943 RepID=A0A1H6FVZ8_9EURY|nr:hypothetical protein [Natronorubrum sediminis]SEH14602.1 hypothetical protein SAMN04487967_1680 [Natronorubrum sediminis]
MASTQTQSDRLNRLKNASVITTAIDATVEIAKGRRKTGLLLLAAAALSSRVPGVGTAASVLLRIYRRLR